MKPAPQTFRDVLALWPTRAALDRKLSGGMSAGLVRQWWIRDSIPEPRWNDVIAQAKADGFKTPITYALLAGFRPGAARKRAAGAHPDRQENDAHG